MEYPVESSGKQYIGESRRDRSVAQLKQQWIAPSRGNGAVEYRTWTQVLRFSPQDLLLDTVPEPPPTTTTTLPLLRPPQSPRLVLFPATCKAAAILGASANALFSRDHDCCYPTSPSLLSLLRRLTSKPRSPPAFTSAHFALTSGSLALLNPPAFGVVRIDDGTRSASPCTAQSESVEAWRVPATAPGKPSLQQDIEPSPLHPPFFLLSSSPPSARNRSLVSKFTDRFSNRTRNVSEFYIQLDEPYKTYFSGELVKGCVVLKVVKPIRITHLVLCLHGYVKVYKTTVAPGDVSDASGFLGPGRGKRNGEYLGNGFATLFEDEVVLCGDGRLVEGIYKFQFEMVFPACRLPSSITFERGTISYMLTSTLTRPTTISPTISCDKRIMLLETIDVAPLPVPKARIISLEPIIRRSKARSKTKSASREQITHSSTVAEPVANGIENKPPLSPVPSELSNSSCMSNSTQSFQIISEPNSAKSVSLANDDSLSSNTPSAERTITATTELSRPGGVPGDVLPVKITIQHTKPIRSPNGIIITLYRQGRIDYHPAIPVGYTEKGKKPVFEDYYPKSRTGLGGLSFGATRSSSVFRKDLTQIFAPLIVDPVTLMATVKTSIRIPEDTFPTITHVPGGMISFRYYLEVVMDLRHHPQTSETNPVVDPHPLTPQVVQLDTVTEIDHHHPYAHRYDEHDYTYENGYDHNEVSLWQGHPQDNFSPYRPPQFIPPVLPQEAVDEKTRLRRAEETLLPSSPADDDGVENEPSAATTAFAPSAPTFFEVDNSYRIPTSRFASQNPDCVSPASAPSIDTITPSPRPNVDMGFPSPKAPQDDKQELERQRLLAQASAPELERGHSTAGNVASGPSIGEEDRPAPSAPMLTEEDLAQPLASPELLPRYQR
ncbi:conserved hypothetical protein [Histoplasma capsulatum var. duboisii H88]|uniref:Arrestin C-terminal-like domain-containing protein n=1 Tax=Ajellomyces capsulatus (strain H88) TaxID=544711 RepID=F0UD61_AJEC8|nr:conserved hypothetical protein [Histoplasma capsulatum var. duboisii H88]